MKDPMDTFLAFERLAREGADGAPPQVSDYPEIYQNVLKKFIALWRIPERAVPSKRTAGQMKRWISELEIITNLMGDKWEFVMNEAFSQYSKGNPFIVASPIAINKLLVSTMAEISRREAEKSEFDIKPVKREESKVSSDEISNLLKTMKKKARNDI